ncbi:hypothetical protein EYF80_051468 [Liparis tanakae]|uniref:Uncharacterized protein n=1 Tax=Liparis tanakae TaxID=230148 RepID=A0A4Z2FBR4_9TELE|nr:hypothetical protein EYF80_051468 [Liparis tanakae]
MAVLGIWRTRVWKNELYLVPSSRSRVRITSAGRGGKRESVLEAAAASIIPMKSDASLDVSSSSSMFCGALASRRRRLMFS